MIAPPLPVAPRLNVPLNAPTVRRLSNGLTIIAEHMPVDAVNLNLWLNIGSAREDAAINGMAHFLEHMIFKGTARLQSGEFERRVESCGARTNAATSQDYTHYYITTAPPDFAALAPLQMDVVLNASIPDDGFERERHVVMEEIRRSQDNPSRRVFHHASELTFQHLPYRRPVLGPIEVIEHLTAQQMRDFHQRWYQPAAMTAVAVGNLPVEQLLDIVEASVENCMAARGTVGARSPNVSSQVTYPVPDMARAELPFDTIVRDDLVDPTLQQARLIMTWRVPGLTDVAETYALDVLSSILAKGRTSRLVQDLREQRGLVSSIAASNMTYLHQGAFYISAQLPVDQVETVAAAIAQHLRDLQSEPVMAAELARVQTRVANNFVFGNETPSDRTSLYGYYQTLLGDLSPALHYPAAIQSLTPKDLQKAARRYLSPDAYGIVVARPSASGGASESPIPA